ncbi:hypothetical protein ACQUJS_06055 [Ralstonia pseudosolanacearum]
MTWLELRYHWPHDEVALQWLSNRGTLFSRFGALPLRSALELSYRHYFEALLRTTEYLATKAPSFA